MDQASGPGQGAWPDEAPRLPSRAAAGAMAGVLVILGAFNVICVGSVAAVVVVFGQIAAGVLTLADATRPAALGAGVFAASFFAGFGGFLLSGWLACRIMGWKTRYTLALRGPTWAGLIVGALGGLVVGVFPGWVAEQLRAAFPDLANQGTLEAIQSILESDNPVEVGLLVVTVSVGAPILEELCFRGLLWNALERVFPGGAGQGFAFVFTSLAFAVAHLDPIQAPAITFTAFFLGWLRLWSGSVWPGVIAHFVNNALATVVGLLVARGMIEGGADAWPIAALGVVLTAGFALFAYLFRRRPLATPEAAWALAPDQDAPRPPAPSDDHRLGPGLHE